MRRWERFAANRVRPGYWFAPKRLGWGATPVTWQGWAATLGYVLLLVLDVHVLRAGPDTKLVLGAALTFGFVYLCWRKTDGAWRWRGGGD